MRRRLALAFGVALAAAGLACQQTSPPVVRQQTYSAAAGSIDLVAIVPFYPRPDLVRRLAGTGIDPEQAAALATSFFGDALAAQGVRVIPASDLDLAFTNQGLAPPRRDPRAAAQMAARKFGATSVVLGEVYRWREREGETYGATNAASIGFSMSLYGTEAVRRLWNSRFDHTQRAFSADPLTARKYPGGGSRWLTAAELARWGAASSAASLVEGQWRGSK